ncbi:MAG: sulfite exporter TauE/SafE family protein [Vulcanimicrobiota bacterium]
MNPVILLFGFGVGLLIGLTGVGGGSLMTPLLILVLGVKPTLAIGTDLAYGAVTKTLGAWRHLRLGHVDWRLSWWLGLGSIPGSLLGVGLIAWLHEVGSADLDQVLLRVLALTLGLVSVSMIVSKTHPPSQPQELDWKARLVAVAIGLLVGILLGMTSVGSGALIALALIVVFRLSPHRVVGTDVFHAAILLWVAGLVHWRLGHVDIELMGNILAGSLPGVWLGSGATERIHSLTLRLTISMVLLASALGLLAKSGYSLPAWLILGLPAVFGLWLSRRMQPRSA